MNSNSKRILAIGMPLAAVAATGVAFAAWTTSGTGTGYGKALGATAVSTKTPAVADAPTAQLYPGSGAIGTLVVDVTNPNSYAVNVSGISLTDAVVAGTSAGDAACAASNFTLDTTQAWSGTAVSITGNGDHAFSIPNALGMVSTAPAGCENVTVNVTLNKTAGSNAISASVGS